LWNLKQFENDKDFEEKTGKKCLVPQRNFEEKSAWTHKGILGEKSAWSFKGILKEKVLAPPKQFEREKCLILQRNFEEKSAFSSKRFFCLFFQHPAIKIQCFIIDCKLDPMF
jgi:hypothetical protein